MIQSPLLPATLACIADQWIGADTGKLFPVHNPATGELLANVPDMTQAESARAVEAASKAMLEHTPTSQQLRKWLTQISALLLEQRQELARIITLEQGKPMVESLAEVEYSAGFFEFCANHLEVLEPRKIAGSIRNCQWTMHHRPAGVAALITPWNFPLAMLAKKLAAALAAGCAVVIKPSELTPLTTIAFCHLLQRLDLQTGRINLVTGLDAGAISKAFFDHDAVRVLSFTGSTEVGRILITNSAAKIKRLSLELGGNAPFIVFADADLDAAADGLMVSKFRAAGQTCVCANRIYVESSVRDAFVQRVLARVAQLKVGNGLDPQTTIGPLINRDAWDKVHHQVTNALEHGARRMTQDVMQRPAENWGAFYPPTVLCGITDSMLVCHEETFGPLVAISEFQSQAQIIAAANSTPFGLAAYLYTADPQRIGTMASALRFGHLGINTGTGPVPQAPFGGMKQSGFGREGGIEGMLEFCEVQSVATKHEA